MISTIQTRDHCMLSCLPRLHGGRVDPGAACMEPNCQDSSSGEPNGHQMAALMDQRRQHNARHKPQREQQEHQRQHQKKSPISFHALQGSSLPHTGPEHRSPRSTSKVPPPYTSPTEEAECENDALFFRRKSDKTSHPSPIAYGPQTQKYREAEASRYPFYSLLISFCRFSRNRPA